MVGNLPRKKYKNYAKLLMPLFMDKRTIFIISTNMCHWGIQFSYKPRRIT